MAKEIATTKVITGKVRLSYQRLFRPGKASKDDKDEKGKYGAVLLIPKKDEKTVKKILKAIENAKELGMSGGKFKGKMPKGSNFKSPLRDGDDKFEETDQKEFKKHWYVNAKSNQRPGIIDAEGEDIDDEDEIKSGDFVKASISFYPYNFEGSKGVGVALNNVMFIEEGEALGGGRDSAQNDFQNDIEAGGNDDDDDDEFEDKKKGKKKPAKKKKADDDDDDDDDAEDEKPKKKKKKKKADDDDDDEDEDDDD